jgi:hypothetical protein
MTASPSAAGSTLVEYSPERSPTRRVKDTSGAETAGRLVRLDTGDSSEAEFARWVQAYACNLAGTPCP